MAEESRVEIQMQMPDGTPLTKDQEYAVARELARDLGEREWDHLPEETRARVEEIGDELRKLGLPDSYVREQIHVEVGREVLRTAREQMG